MKEIKFYGRGGQGVVTASKILVSVVVKEGGYAHAVPSFGQERKGAPVYAFARIAEEPLDLRSFVYKPDGVIVFDLFVRDLGVNIVEGVKPGGVLVANTPLPPGDTGLTGNFSKIGCLDAFALTREILGQVPPNAVMLGAVCRTTGWFKIESLCEVLREYMPGRKGEMNVEAAKRGFAAVQLWEG